jgi:hypothetical protein
MPHILTGYISVWGVQRDNSALYKADYGQGHELIELDRVWFEQPTKFERLLQVEHGEKGVVEWRNDPSVNCMDWVQEKSIDPNFASQGADSTDTIFPRKRWDCESKPTKT